MLLLLCVHAAAAIEEPAVRRLHWMVLFSQRVCLVAYPISAAPKEGLGWIGLGEIMRRIKLRAKPKYEISFHYTVI